MGWLIGALVPNWWSILCSYNPFNRKNILGLRKIMALMKFVCLIERNYILDLQEILFLTQRN